jgi:N-acetylmuramoyl-L-alanine amidase
MRYNPSALKIRLALPVLLLLALASAAPAQMTSPLAPKPDWSDLDKYQESITRVDFLSLLDTVYAPGGAWKPFITVGDTSASILTHKDAPPYVLRFAAAPGAIKPAPRFWRQKSQMPARPDSRPLNGVRIALDPGHVGGIWAKQEERWFVIGKSAPVTEGDMTLLVAKLLVPRLEALGAQVWLTRSKAEPVTPDRPDDLRKIAPASLAAKQEPATPDAVQREINWLFFRESEIRSRAEVVNALIKPDLVLCLHVNAEPWGDPEHPTLTDKNHMHFLITGCFSEKEVGYEDQRLTMLEKLLSRAYREELAIAETVATAMAKATGLPPYEYTTPNALKLGSSPYIWARNLAANRLFQCPVLYVEPYVQNSHAVFDRVQAGDYEGTRLVGGKMQKSIYREYADGIVKGLVDYYSMQ